MTSRNPLSLIEKQLRDFPSTRRYLIGVSGGRDSIALLNLLLGFGYEKLVICHLDHQLRGAASRADARFVAKVAQNLGVDCEIGSANISALAKRSKLSIETAARFARLAFFVEASRHRRCSTIFLAHHADDLVETALLNLFRGAGPGGVAALRGVSIHRIGETKLTIIRPLLAIWRKEIDAYIRQKQLVFREDKTNARLDSSRNRIRHRILPYIDKAFGRDVHRAIWRTAVIWADEEALLNSMLPSSSDKLDVASLRELSVALQRRVLFRWLQQSGTPNITFDLVERIRSLLEPSSATAKVNIPGNRYVRRRAKKMFMEG